MKTEQDIRTEIEVRKAIRAEIAEQYTALSREDLDNWRGKRLEQRWEREDSAIYILKWVLNEQT